ncbi:MAG: hypothetical protein KC505_07240 [Myxococcales bacterium]|nr:hypothetical protein [Myxococcales bacterium]USN51550.1 MAG: hypothetical protein H6731_03845 [Myxococcales bacterium]
MKQPKKAIFEVEKLNIPEAYIIAELTKKPHAQDDARERAFILPQSEDEAYLQDLSEDEETVIIIDL